MNVKCIYCPQEFIDDDDDPLYMFPVCPQCEIRQAKDLANRCRYCAEYFTNPETGGYAEDGICLHCTEDMLDESL